MDDKSKLPWENNDTINFNFYHYGYNGGFDLPQATLLEYTPSSLILRINIIANDIIGNEFKENFATYNLIDDWNYFHENFNESIE